MNELANRIESLEDKHALRMLKSLAKAQAPLVDAPEPSPELAASLREQIQAAPETAPSEGDLARAALLLLAGDPDHAPLIEARIREPDPALRRGRNCAGRGGTDRARIQHRIRSFQRQERREILDVSL